MKPLPFHRDKRLGLLMAATTTATLFLSSCSHTSDSKVPEMITLSARLQPLFEQTRTICFGRFMVDVPASATVVFGPAQIEGDIDRYTGEAATLDRDIAARLTEIDEEMKSASGNVVSANSMSGRVLHVGVPGQKLVFGPDKVSGSFYRIQSYFPSGNDYFLQETGSRVVATEMAKIEGQTTEQRIADLVEVATHLRPRADDDIPTEPGICIDGAFVSDLGRPIHERTTIGIRLNEFPDVHLSIDAHKNGEYLQGEHHELLRRLEQTRLDGEQRGLGDWYAHVKFLRRGPRTIGDWPGAEVLARKPKQATEGSAHEFVFESVGKPMDPMYPFWSVELNTGVADNQNGAVPPSISDDEAVELWDKLTSTIRVRPTGPVKVSQLVPDSVPLGEVVATGRPCPESGWWLCDIEPVPVLGGRKQHFRKGETMPNALLLTDRSLGQRIRGEQPTTPRATFWTYVARGNGNSD